MQETWKAVPGTNNKIEVSSLGRARSFLRNNRVLRLQTDKKGYLRFTVSIERKKHTFKIHRLVAELFIDNPRRLPQVNHKDGNKKNNTVNNLEWVSNLDNAHHAIKAGLWENVFKASAESNEKRKIPICAINIESGETLFFGSMSDAERAIGTKHINACIKGERSQACGYRFSYADKRG